MGSAARVFDTVSTHNPHRKGAMTDSIRQAIASIEPAGLLQLDADLAIDAHGVASAPGSILLDIADLEHWQGKTQALPVASIRIIASGGPEVMPDNRGAHQRIRLPGVALLPGLVNAHAHLDLTGIGPRARDLHAPFSAWLDMIRRERPFGEEAITRAVLDGVEASIAGGVAAVGDIAGAAGGKPSLIPCRVLANAPLHGVSFVEFFGIGRGEARAYEAIEMIAALIRRPYERVRLGLSPHAPNTVGLAGYALALRIAAETASPICTHGAESLEERQFISEARGPQRALLETLGIWDDRMLREIGQGKSPIAHLGELLRAHPGMMTLIHANDASDSDLDLLRASRTPVVYCPRSVAYFGHERELGRHRWRDMLDAGIPVALGTDSIVSLAEGPDPLSSTRLSPLDEIRWLCRDRPPPQSAGILAEAKRLLAMATTTSASAIRLDPARATLQPGTRPFGITMVDIGEGPATLESTISRLLFGFGAPSLLFGGK